MKDPTHDLVKSLTKGEKRHFKLMVQNPDKNYVRLFNAMDAQDHYNEANIKRQFGNEKFVKQLHVTKAYLYNQVMASLRKYHADKSVSMKLKDRLQDIEILYNKELLDDAIKVVEHAIPIAEKYEKLNLLLELYGWRRRLIIATIGASRGASALNQLYQLERDTLSKLDEQQTYWDMTVNFFDPKHIKQRNILSGELPETLMAKQLHYHLLYAGTLMMDRRSTDAFKYLEQLIDMLEANPHRIQEDPISYITALQNKISFMLFRKEQDKIPDVLNAIRQVPAKYGLKQDSAFSIKTYLKTCNIELELYRDTGDFKAGTQLVPQVVDYMQRYSKLVPPDYSIMLRYQFAYLYYMANRFDVAINYVNQILDLNLDTREDLQTYTRFLNLILHFELDNVFLMRYLVDSTKRFLKRKREVKPFEQTLLRFFSKISNVADSKKRTLFEKLRLELFTGMNESERNNVLDYINFEIWIDKHLQ